MTAAPFAGAGSYVSRASLRWPARSTALSCAPGAARRLLCATGPNLDVGFLRILLRLEGVQRRRGEINANLAWPTGTGWSLGRPVAAFGQRSVVRGFASCCGDPRVLCWVNAFAGVDLTRRIAALAESPVLSRTARGSDATHDHSNTAAP